MKTPLSFALLAILFLSGCSASHKATKHLRKAKKHILKAESFGAVWSKDTVYQEIAIPVPEIRRDTIFKAVQGDTVTIEKERLSIKYVRLAEDSVFIEGICKADTIYKEVPIQVNNEISCPPDRWKTPAFVFGGLLVLFIVLLLGYLYFNGSRERL